MPLPEDLPACAELFQEGTPVDLDKFGRACRNESEDLEVPRYANVKCADGNRLVWNQFAWGYDKEPMHLFAVDDPIKIPTDQVDQCQAGTGEAAPTTAP